MQDTDHATGADRLLEPASAESETPRELSDEGHVYFERGLAQLELNLTYEAAAR